MGNLNLPQVAAAQNQKEVTINAATAALDLALTATLIVDLSAADATLTAAQYQSAMVFKATGNAVARTLTLPAIARQASIVNAGGFALTVACGSTTLSVAAAASAIVATDGTANGLTALGGGDSSPGTGGTSLSLTDGTTTLANVTELTLIGATLSGDPGAAVLTVTPGGAPSTPVDIAVWIAGLPAAGEKLLQLDLARAITLPAGLVGSRALAAAASTGSVAFSVQKNGAEVGTITFAASAAGVFAMAADTIFAAGDVLGIIAPASADATLADIAITLSGTR